jgi:tellurite resistance-related uncharacterized protein
MRRDLILFADTGAEKPQAYAYLVVIKGAMDVSRSADSVSTVSEILWRTK